MLFVVICYRLWHRCGLGVQQLHKNRNVVSAKRNRRSMQLGFKNYPGAKVSMVSVSRQV